MGYLCANFSLPRPLCSRLRPGVRDRQTLDAHHRLMPPPYTVKQIPVQNSKSGDTPAASSLVIRSTSLKWRLQTPTWHHYWITKRPLWRFESLPESNHQIWMQLVYHHIWSFKKPHTEGRGI